MIVPKGHKIAPQYRDVSTVRIPQGCPDAEEYEEAQLASAMFQDFPVIWAWELLFSEEALLCIDPCIDWNFYYHAIFEL
jgi:hypothetical protein